LPGWSMAVGEVLAKAGRQARCVGSGNHRRRARHSCRPSTGGAGRGWGAWSPAST
jgi:hypothetical protein